MGSKFYEVGKYMIVADNITYIELNVVLLSGDIGVRVGFVSNDYIYLTDKEYKEFLDLVNQQ